MTYADQLNILNASVKLKKTKAERAFLRVKRGFKNEEPILKYLVLEEDFLKEHNYYINFFTYCVRYIIDINIESEFKTI